MTWGASFPTAYKIQLSYDGTKWADAYTTSSGAGGDTFVGINGKARYLRVSSDNCPAAGCSIADLQVGGSFLALENLAGGKTYDKPATDGSYPDNGNSDSTDGVLAAGLPRPPLVRVCRTE